MKLVILFFFILQLEAKDNLRPLLNEWSQKIEEVKAGPEIDRNCLPKSLKIKQNSPEKKLTKKAKSIELPFYERSLDAQAYAILCLNVGVAKNLAHKGHSTTTLFTLEHKNPKSEVHQSHEIFSAGFWPWPQREASDNYEKEHYLLYNWKDDHFLTFQNDYYDEAYTHCVPITKAEAQKHRDYLNSRKDDKWGLRDNCNDLSTEAFEVATGIKLDPTSLRYAGCAHPGVLLDRLKKYQQHLVPKAQFSYETRIKDEVEMIEEAEKKKAKRK